MRKRIRTILSYPAPVRYGLAQNSLFKLVEAAAKTCHDRIAWMTKTLRYPQPRAEKSFIGGAILAHLPGRATTLMRLALRVNCALLERFSCIWRTGRISLVPDLVDFFLAFARNRLDRTSSDTVNWRTLRTACRPPGCLAARLVCTTVRVAKIRAKKGAGACRVCDWAVVGRGFAAGSI